MSEQELPHELDSRPQSRREWSGHLRSLVLPLALLAAIVGGLLYLQARGESPADSEYGTVELPAEKNVTGRDASAEEGRAAPDFLLRDLGGSALRLSDLQGRPVVVNFWASWCAPCRQEMPELVQAQIDNQQRGLLVVAVNVREGEPRARAFAEEFTLPFAVVLDSRGEVSRTWRIGGPTGGLPSSYFIDARGVVRKVVYGSLTQRALDEGLGLILGGG
jgi:peroxiredoxin